MTSLVNQDPAASDVLGKAAAVLGDAVCAAPDFQLRVAAVERWVGMMLDKGGPDGRSALCRADDRTPGPCADRGPRCKIRPQYQSVPVSFRYPSRDDAKTVCTNDPVRQDAGRSSHAPSRPDRHHPRTRLLRSGPFHPRMPRFRRPCRQAASSATGTTFFSQRMTKIYKRFR